MTADYRKAQVRSRQVADRLTRGIAFLMRKNHITVVAGTAQLRSATRVEATHRWRAQPRCWKPSISFWRRVTRAPLPGVTVDGRRVWTSYEALQVEAAPESLIIGAGAVGVEFASVFATYGTRVTLIEMLPTLVPLEDPDIAEVLELYSASAACRS